MAEYNLSIYLNNADSNYEVFSYITYTPSSSGKASIVSPGNYIQNVPINSDSIEIEATLIDADRCKFVEWLYREGSSSGALQSSKNNPFTYTGSKNLIIRPVGDLYSPGKGTITSVSATSTSITLEGSEVNYSNRYEFVLNDGTATYFYESSPSHTYRSLKPGTQYKVNYRGVNYISATCKKDGSYNSNATKTIWTLPTQPTKLEATEITTNSITVEWKASEGASYYLLWVGAYDGSYSNTFKNITTTSCKITGLSDEKTYQIQLTPYNANGDKGTAIKIDATTKEDNSLAEPGTPSFKSIVRTDTSITLEGNIVSNATRYDFYCTEFNTGTSLPSALLQESNVYTFDNLTPGTKYKINYRGVNYVDANNKNDGSPINPTPTTWTLPSNPTGLEATEIKETSITVSWKEAAGAVSYQIYYETIDGQTNGSIPTTSTSTSITGLKKGTTYNIFCTSYNNNKPSSDKAGDPCAEAIKITVTTAGVVGKYVWVYTGVSTNNGWQQAIPWVYTGVSTNNGWQQAIAKVWDGSKWLPET